MSIQPIPPYHTIIYNRYSGQDAVIEYTMSQAEWDALEAAGWYYGTDTFQPPGQPPAGGDAGAGAGAVGGCLISLLMLPVNLIRFLF